MLKEGISIALREPDIGTLKGTIAEQGRGKVKRYIPSKEPPLGLIGDRKDRRKMEDLFGKLSEDLSGELSELRTAVTKIQVYFRGYLERSKTIRKQKKKAEKRRKQKARKNYQMTTAAIKVQRAIRKYQKQKREFPWDLMLGLGREQGPLFAANEEFGIHNFYLGNVRLGVRIRRDITPTLREYRILRIGISLCIRRKIRMIQRVWRKQRKERKERAATTIQQHYKMWYKYKVNRALQGIWQACPPASDSNLFSGLAEAFPLIYPKVAKEEGKDNTLVRYLKHRTEAAVQIQKNVRRYLRMKQYWKLLIQSNYDNLTQHVGERKKAVVRIQKNVRRYLGVERYQDKELKGKIEQYSDHFHSLVQNGVPRCIVEGIMLARLREHVRPPCYEEIMGAATQIQKNVRRYFCIKQYKALRKKRDPLRRLIWEIYTPTSNNDLFCELYSRFTKEAKEKGKDVTLTRYLELRTEAAVRIQKNVRRYICMRQYYRMLIRQGLFFAPAKRRRKAATLIQKNVRRYFCVKWYKEYRMLTRQGLFFAPAKRRRKAAILIQKNDRKDDNFDGNKDDLDDDGSNPVAPMCPKGYPHRGPGVPGSFIGPKPPPPVGWKPGPGRKGPKWWEEWKKNSGFEAWPSQDEQRAKDRQKLIDRFFPLSSEQMQEKEDDKDRNPKDKNPVDSIISFIKQIEQMRTIREQVEGQEKDGIINHIERMEEELTGMEMELRGI